MLKKIKNRLMKKREEKGAAVEDRKSSTLAERLDSHMEAVTFAEAGLHEPAEDIIRADMAEKAKILVVGKENTFSKPVIDYAVGFAERMGYEILAMNVGPVPRDSSETLGSYSDLICEQFKARCNDSVEAFRKACEENEISFKHIVKFGQVDDCIKEAHGEIKRVEFVITEPESCPEEGRVAIPVFCMTR